jgi:hypothetical protein
MLNINRYDSNLAAKSSLNSVDLVHLVLGSDFEASSSIGQIDFAFRVIDNGSLGRLLVFSGSRCGRFLSLVFDVLGRLNFLSPALLTRLADSLGRRLFERLALESDGAGTTTGVYQEEPRK